VVEGEPVVAAVLAVAVEACSVDVVAFLVAVVVGDLVNAEMDGCSLMMARD